MAINGDAIGRHVICQLGMAFCTKKVDSGEPNCSLGMSLSRSLFRSRRHQRSSRWGSRQEVVLDYSFPMLLKHTTWKFHSAGIQDSRISVV